MVHAFKIGSLEQNASLTMVSPVLEEMPPHGVCDVSQLSVQCQHENVNSGEVSSLQFLLEEEEQKKSAGERSGEYSGCFSFGQFILANLSLTR